MPESHEGASAPVAKSKRAEKVSKVLVNKSRSIAIVVITLLVLSAGIAIALDLSSKADVKGWEALYKITQPDILQAEVTTEEATPEAVMKVANTFKDSSVEPHALFLAASKYLAPPADSKPNPYGMPRERVAETAEARTLRLTNAQTALERIISKYPTHDFAPKAKAMLGVVHEEQGDFEKAVEVLLALNNEIDRDMHPNFSSTLKIKIKYDLGRNYYLCGKLDKAKQHVERAARYDDLVDVTWYGRSYRDRPDWVAKAMYLRTVIGIGEDALDVTLSEPKDEAPEAPQNPVVPIGLKPAPGPAPGPAPQPVKPQ